MENLQHESPIPALRYYKLQHMDAKKKKACEDWHAEEVLKGEDWNFKKELLSYCESDVKLLKEGCLKFAEDTIRDAGFNPLLQCITIACTCHYFWRNFQMEPSTIAVEPPHGRGGLKTSQSKVAFQWLYYQDKQSGHGYHHWIQERLSTADELEWPNATLQWNQEKRFIIKISSLYPTINKYGTFPTGHPQILVNPESQTSMITLV